MYSLLLDSSNRNLSVAIGLDGRVFAAKEYDAWQQQSELMIPAIEALLKENHLTLQHLNNIVVAIGPGSYTGVRIAVTIAKIMAFLLNVPLYSVSSLAVLTSFEIPTICLANARSGRSYFAVYRANEKLVVDTILTNEEVMAYIQEHRDYAVTGDLGYLNLTSATFNRFTNMLNNIKEENRVNDLLAVKPIYLKD